MDVDEKEKFSGKICCFGISHVGVPVSALMAQMCPNFNFVVVDLNPERIMLWNTKHMPIREPGLREILRKCQNRNLIFTPNTTEAIRMADIIFLSLDSPIYSDWSKEKKTDNLKDFEEAARLIAEVSETNKIIVLKNTISVGSNEVIKRILMANKMDSVKFQVLSIPEFFSTGSAISNLLSPDRVLIGSDLTKEALKATEILTFIYSHWVPRDKIVTMSSQSAELTRLSHNAFLAQRLSSLNTLAIMCEELGADISDVVKMIGKCSGIGTKYLEPSYGFGGSHLKNDLIHLKYMCENLNLFEAAEYWNQVLLINEFQKKRFFKKIRSSFFNTLNHKKVAIWGMTFKKNAETLKGSVAVELCLKLLDEGAKLALYDSKMERRDLMNELNTAGVVLPSEEVVLYDDPYKAAYKTDAIILCTDWDEFNNLNYNLIYKDMLKPAYIFDGRKCLPHEELIKIGFIVKTIGKEFYQTKTYLYQ